MGQAKHTGCNLVQPQVLIWGCSAEPPGAQLGPLSQPLQTFLVPHLRLADVQRLGHDLPEATLQQLAQARAQCSGAAWAA